MAWSSIGGGLRILKNDIENNVMLNAKTPICNKLQVDYLGNIYAAGDFDTVDGWAGIVPGFAKWNGIEWSPIFTTF
jgi:hypothetical protein